MRRLLQWTCFFTAAVIATPSNVFAQQKCDRACLRTMLDAYLNSVIKHDPNAAPLAVGFRQTENAINVRAGNAGVWKSVTALGAVQRRFVDAVSGQAAYYGIVLEGS